MKIKRSTSILVSGSFGFVFVLGLMLFLSMSVPNVQAASSSKVLTGLDKRGQPEGTDQVASLIYIPIVHQGAVAELPTLELPTLVSPVDGAVLDTLKPHFVFNAGTLPENTGGVLDFSTNPDPNRTGWEGEFSIQSGEHLDLVTYYNLEPNTTYYWRVGVIENSDYNQPPQWTQQWSFTTGPAEGDILPAPNLLAPSSDSTISTDRVVLEWAAVPGAEEYDVIFYDFDQDYYHFWNTTDTFVDITGNAFIRPGSYYEWFVEAGNNYAWGTSSEVWNFTVSAAASSQQPQAQAIDRVTQVHRDGHWMTIAK